MTPAQHLAMQIGSFVICAGVVMLLAGVVLLTFWVLNKALWAAVEKYGSVKLFFEFCRWKRDGREQDG